MHAASQRYDVVVLRSLAVLIDLVVGPLGVVLVCSRLTDHLMTIPRVRVGLRPSR